MELDRVACRESQSACNAAWLSRRSVVAQRSGTDGDGRTSGVRLRFEASQPQSPSISLVITTQHTHQNSPRSRNVYELTSDDSCRYSRTCQEGVRSPCSRGLGKSSSDAERCSCNSGTTARACLYGPRSSCPMNCAGRAAGR